MQGCSFLNVKFDRTAERRFLRRSQVGSSLKELPFRALVIRCPMGTKKGP